MINRVKGSIQENKDKKQYMKILNIQDKHNKEFFDMDGCVVEDEKGNIRIQHDNLSRDNEADLFEIITYSEFWKPDPNKNAEGNKESYQKYMDIETVDNKEQESGDISTPTKFSVCFIIIL